MLSYTSPATFREGLELFGPVLEARQAHKHFSSFVMLLVLEYVTSFGGITVLCRLLAIVVRNHLCDNLIGSLQLLDRVCGCHRQSRNKKENRCHGLELEDELASKRSADAIEQALKPVAVDVALNVPRVEMVEQIEDAEPDSCFEPRSDHAVPWPRSE